MTSFSSNPFSWDNSSAKVQSAVISLSLSNGSGNGMDTSNFSTPVSLFVPRDDSKMPNFTHFNVRPLGNDEYMQYHSVRMTSLDNSIHVQVKPHNESVTFKIILLFNERPSLKKHDFIWTLPDFSSCIWKNISRIKTVNVALNETENSKTVEYVDQERHCDNDPYTVFVSNALVTKLGLYYIGKKTLISMFFFIQSPRPGA